MKTNTRTFGSKKVYYFDNKRGVTKKRHLSIRLTQAFIVMTFLLGIGGTYSLYYNQQEHEVYSQQKTSMPAAAPIPNEPQPDINSLSTRAQEDSQLSSVIRAKIKTMPKNQQWSVHVRDLRSNRMANVDADELYETASLYKLFLLPALEYKINAHNWNNKFGQYTFQSCVDAMIRISDNYCGESIGAYAGWSNVDKINENLGFTKTKLGGKSQVTTAGEVGDLMYRLQNGQILSDKARRTVFDSLYKQKYIDGIPKSCHRDDCLVANKTGDIGVVRHDAAIVTSDNAQYVLVIMSKGGSWKQIADLATDINLAMTP